MMPQDNPDDFETRLGRQPLKQVPGTWRAEILAAAQAAQPATRAARPALFPALTQSFAALLWPHPKAWAGLATVWLLIATLHFSMRETPAGPVLPMARPSPEVLAELRQQHRLYAELMGPNQAPDSDRPRPVLNKPRTYRDKAQAV
jgi:hypothetical protein